VIGGKSDNRIWFVVGFSRREFAFPIEAKIFGLIGFEE
jgi:hypothetical protein